MRYAETDVIVDVGVVELDPAVPQMSNTPRFLRVPTRTTEGGQLDLRISISAAAKLAEALATHGQVRGSP